MNFDLALPVLIGLVLIGLARSTESVLEIRQRRRDNGVDLKTYL